MSIKKKLVVCAMIATMLLVVTTNVFAQSGNSFNAGTPNNGSITINGTSGVVAIFCNVFNIIFWLFLSISIVIALYGAYLFITGGDNAEKITSARKTIMYAMLGVAVVLIAKSGPFLVSSFITEGVGQGQAVHACEGSTVKVGP